MPDYRHMRSGSLNTPSGGAQGSGMGGAPRFEGPRSPPNTSHVPCKFFRQGACQAGSACPFSHDLGNAAETICKYFAKGNCKFGPKCANIHVLPDGRRINYGKNGVTISPSSINLAGHSPHTPTSPTSATVANVAGGTLDGGRQHPQAQSSTSALTNSLYGADAYATAFQYDDRHSQHNHLDQGLPILDVPYSHSNSKYGSPRDDDGRFGLGLSPVNGLSVMDAPLPASFDSNGISNAARFPAAPWPSSVPSKFGLLESSSPSLKDSRTSDTLKLLHTSAFGSSEHLLTPTASSPPGSQQGNGSEEYFGKRTMHSSRFPRPKMLSSSLPKNTSVDRDWQPEFAFDDDNDNLPENYVPENLQDLLTPAEKARRGSIRADENVSIDGITKYGSPFGTSPSRWAPVFAKDDDLSRSARGAASAFGHVGSPLRNSILAQQKPDIGGLGRPSSSRTGSDSMSMLSQQLQRNRIDDGPSGSNPLLHPISARSVSGPIGKDRHMERHVSSGSISSSMVGRFTTPIDEEESAFVFNMEEEDEAAARKRASNGMSMGTWTNYASVVSGKAHTNGGGKERDSLPVNGQ